MSVPAQDQPDSQHALDVSKPDEPGHHPAPPHLPSELGDPQPPRPSVLQSLLYPDRHTTDLAKYLPLEAAAQIVTTLRSVPDGQATPPKVVDDVLHLAESADPAFTPWPLQALYRLAMAISRPGDTPTSDDNAALIRRLLRISVGDPEGRYGQYDFPLISLYGALPKRRPGSTDVFLLADEKEDTREYARLVSTAHMRLPVLRDRISHRFARESDAGRREALAEELRKAHEEVFRNEPNIDTRLAAAFKLGEAYAKGTVLRKDGEKAKLWWERTFNLGWKKAGLRHGKAISAALVLAQTYLGQQPVKYGKAPLFARDVTRANRYLQLTKWTDGTSANLLGKMYDRRTTSVAEHVRVYGVSPDDAAAADCYAIGAEKFRYAQSRVHLAMMIFQGRARPVADPAGIRAVQYVPPYPLSSASSAEDEAEDDAPAELERAVALYDGSAEPAVAYADDVSRQDAVEYAWALVQPVAAFLTLKPSAPIAVAVEQAVADGSLQVMPGSRLAEFLVGLERQGSRRTVGELGRL